METTTYESPFPSGLYQPNIQAERRLNSPLTVAAANAFNRHDVEIRRIEEVIGTGLPTGADPGTVMDRLVTLEDMVSPSGIVHDYVGPFHNGLGDGIPITPDMAGNTTISGHAQDTSIHGGTQYGNTMEFHSDPSDDNYAYIQWLLTWMGMWNTLSAGGTVTPSIIEVVKALWQNKYDLEVLFEPTWLSNARRWDNATIPGTIVFQYTAAGGEKFFAGYMDDNDECPPIGGAGNLDSRPWPIYRAYCVTCGGWLDGLVEMTAGHVIQFFNWEATEAQRLAMSLVDSGDDHWLGLFQGPANPAVGQPNGASTSSAVPATAFPSYTGLGPVIKIPPPIIPIPGSGAEPLPSGLKHYKGPVGWDWDPWFQVSVNPISGHLDGLGGTIKIGPGDVTASRPLPLTSNPLAWVQVPGSWQYGGDMAIDAFQSYISTHPGWNCIYAQIVAPYGAPGWKPTDLHCYVDPMPYNGFNPLLGTPYPPAGYDFAFTPPVPGYQPNQIYTIPLGYIFTEPGGEGVVLITASDEGRVPGPLTEQYYILSLSTKFVSEMVVARQNSV
jgi:hypothetical protein